SDNKYPSVPPISAPAAIPTPAAAHLSLESPSPSEPPKAAPPPPIAAAPIAAPTIVHLILFSGIVQPEIPISAAAKSNQYPLPLLRMLRLLSSRTIFSKLDQTAHVSILHTRAGSPYFRSMSAAPLSR